MTITSAPPRPTAVDGPSAGRRTMVTLAVIYLGLFAVLMATGADREPDANPAKLIADYGVSRTGAQLMTYTAVVTGVVLVFFGAALRSVLVSRGRRWTTDIVMLGFALMAITLVTWAVTALALYHAVDIGDTKVVQAINVLDTTNFPFAMLGMACTLLAVGVTALREQALPTWLCWVSIVLGAMSPLGPLAFAPFFLFAVWTVVVAATIRLPEAA
ncbi:hypothetical protein [Nocardioides pocheonensis]|uniref:DUF4386 family protein n=1 Tax=Nocardioides pocheonensis TaxID=661485 RepID=A0A3N0GNA6_9ACTN|nr:hypothetical protein [Nocardioides pocheonensis]RNM13851.1 hypothetical protein EFL26_12875 [Nocardioides pocheonensis]